MLRYNIILSLALFVFLSLLSITFMIPYKFVDKELISNEIASITLTVASFVLLILIMKLKNKIS